MEIYLQGGCFWGSQYRTGIYYTHGQDVPVIEAAMKSLEKGI
jgi:peptide methionine sulfoxide reductase MsrA